MRLSASLAGGRGWDGASGPKDFPSPFSALVGVHDADQIGDRGSLSAESDNMVDASVGFAGWGGGPFPIDKKIFVLKKLN